MKFTKEQVLENIKAKFRTADGKTSQKLSDRTILETVEPLLAFANDETELTEFVDKVFVGVNSANANFIKDTTDFVKSYKPEVAPQNNPPADPPKGDPQLPDFAALIEAAVSKAVTPLQDKLGAFEKAKTVEQLMSDAKAKFFGGDYAKHYKDDADAAWERVVELNEAKGFSMTADEISAKATTYFDTSVSKRGIDTTKPFEGSGGQSKPNFAEDVEILKAEGLL